MALAVVKAADLQAMDRTIRTGFMGAYNNNAYKPRWPMIATRQPSASAKNIYPQMIDAATVREWTSGARKINGLVLEGATVTNSLWELTYGIRRVDIDDDLSGTVSAALSRMRSGASKYARHPDRLVFNVIKGNSTGLDGLSLFHASHKINPADPASATQSNTDSGALTPANAAAVRAKMMEIKLPDGDPANEEPNILIVPPALELTARKIAQADVVVFGTVANETNVYKGMFTVVVVPQLAAAYTDGSDSAWYMVDASDPEDRAVIFQDREGVEVVAQFNPADPLAFSLDQYVWGTRARYTAAGGNWKKIARRTG